MQPIPRSPAVSFNDSPLDQMRPMSRRERANNIFQWHFTQMSTSEQAAYDEYLRLQQEAIRQRMIIRIRRKQFAHVLQADIPLPKKQDNKKT